MAARAYRSDVRAESSKRTREAILDATIALAYELERVDLSLEQIADRAQRSVQTLLRHFGSRDALIEAAVQRGTAQVREERRPRTGTRSEALELLVSHYELRGRFVLRLLSIGDAASEVTGPGMLLHRAWVEDVFGDEIERAGDQQVELIDVLVVATDVSAWKLLRIDRGLEQAVVCERMTLMTEALVARIEGNRQ